MLLQSLGTMVRLPECIMEICAKLSELRQGLLLCKNGQIT
jgi:hypothetical protein